MFKSLFFLLALVAMTAAQTTAPAASGSAVPVVAVPIGVPVVIPVAAPVSVPSAVTAKGPKTVKKAKSPSASKGTKLTAGKGKGPRRHFR